MTLRNNTKINNTIITTELSTCRNPRLNIPLTNIRFSACGNFVGAVDMDRSPLFATSVEEMNNILEAKKNPRIHIWDLNTGITQLRFKLQDFAKDLVISSDAEVVVALGEGNTIYIWDVFESKYRECNFFLNKKDEDIIGFGIGEDTEDIYFAVIDFTEEYQYLIYRIDLEHDPELLDENGIQEKITWQLHDSKTQYLVGNAMYSRVQLDITHSTKLNGATSLATADLIMVKKNGSEAHREEVFDWPIDGGSPTKIELANKSPRKGYIYKTGKKIAFLNNDEIDILHLDF